MIRKEEKHRQQIWLHFGATLTFFQGSPNSNFGWPITLDLLSFCKNQGDLVTPSVLLISPHPLVCKRWEFYHIKEHNKQLQKRRKCWITKLTFYGVFNKSTKINKGIFLWLYFFLVKSSEKQFPYFIMENRILELAGDFGQIIFKFFFLSTATPIAKRWLFRFSKQVVRGPTK